MFEVASGASWDQVISPALLKEPSALPVHVRLTQLLQQFINRGLWKPGEQIPTQRELAEHFGLSVLTVNKSVSALVRDGLLDRQQGKGTFVAGPTTEAGGRLAVVMHCPLEGTEGDYYIGGLVRGIQASLSPYGFSYSLSYLDEWMPDSLAAMPRQQLSGVLLVAPTVDRWPDIERLWNLGLPVVVLGASWPAAQVPTVDSDNIGGTQAALRHLLSLGHREIGCIYPSQRFSNHRDRLRAFHDFVTAHDLTLDPRWVVEHRPDAPDAGVPELRAFLELEERPTAVLAGNYHAASQLVRVAQDMGIRIPEELSIVGIDDPYSASCLTPPLTTVSQPLSEMGKEAMDMLLKLCQGAPREEIKSKIFKATLSVRQSSRSRHEAAVMLSPQPRYAAPAVLDPVGSASA